MAKYYWKGIIYIVHSQTCLTPVEKSLHGDSLFELGKGDGGERSGGRGGAKVK